MEQRGAVSINELTEILGVSHMTIRRDVSKLEEQGLLVSVSGGVRAVSRLAAEPSHLVKSTLQSEEKQAIGALAASHIAKNSCIYLDAGTTTTALARAILDRNDLRVVTNDFEITQLLIDASQCGVIHTGGTLCRENRSCVGESAARTLRHLAIDTAFISASGWDSRGIFTPDENKVTVKETVSRQREKHPAVRQFEIQSGGHVYGVTFDPVHHHHYRPASFRCRRQSYRPARLRGAAGRITRAATAGLALPVFDQRRADPGDLLISLGHARRGIPQINHHNALCFVIRAKQGDNPARTPLASSGLIGDKPARRQHGADQRSGDPIVHHPLQQLPLRTGAQTLAGQQLAQGRGHAGRGSGVAGVAGKRLIQFRFPAVKAGDVVADLAQKAVNPAGPPTVASSRLAALLSLMVMAAAQSSPTVMPSARCFSLTGE